MSSIVANSRGGFAFHMRRLDGFGAAEWRINAMNKTFDAFFAGATTAYSVRVAESGVWEIEHSEDGGFTWTSGGQTSRTGLPYPVLHPLPKPQWLLMSSPVGELTLSRDGGNIWEPLGRESR